MADDRSSELAAKSLTETIEISPTQAFQSKINRLNKEVAALKREISLINVKLEKLLAAKEE